MGEEIRVSIRVNYAVNPIVLQILREHEICLVHRRDEMSGLSIEENIY